MQIDATYQVALYLDNVECIYDDMWNYCAELADDALMTDQERIDQLSDRLELVVNEHYLSGQETDAGDWLIRTFLADVGWTSIATSFYSDFIAT